MKFMFAFGLASIMLCIGTLLRAKVKVFQKMLVPSSVIAGILGFFFLNVLSLQDIDCGADSAMYTEIVNQLFTISFISITLTSAPGQNKNTAKNIMSGVWGMGIVWCILYALQALSGMLIATVLGKYNGMDNAYGTLVAFAFAQGPGQSAAFGKIYEGYGYQNAAMIAVTFAVIGFCMAFLVGIPFAKKGIRQGYASNCGRIEPAVLRGYYRKEEQTEYMVKDTTCNSNIETLTFHFAVIGVCYMLALGISKIFSCIPGFFGSSMSGLMFMNGMFAAYIVKWIMKKTGVDFLKESTLQNKITGWTADYLVVCSFMAVEVKVLGKWMMPIIVISIAITVLTAAVCFFFGKRFGGSNDFERTLGLYGTCTGTVASGISLVRIVDPEFKTITALELGMMNLVMLLSTPVYILLLGMASGEVGKTVLAVSLSALVVIYVVLLRVFKAFGKRTY